MATAFALALMLQDVDALIGKLGNDDAAVRDGATAELKKAGPKAVPALKKALESKDAEVAARARAILAFIEPPPLVKAERDATEATRKRLAEQKITLSLQGVSDQSILEVLSAQAKAGFCVMDGLALEPVNVQAKDLPVGVILEDVARQVRLKIQIVRGTIVAYRGDWPEQGLPGPAPEALDPSRLTDKAKAALESLAAHKVTYMFERANGTSVLEIMAKESGTAVSKEAGRINEEVTVFARSVPADVLLRLMCLQAKVDWSVDEEGRICIHPRK